MRTLLALALLASAPATATVIATASRQASQEVPVLREPRSEVAFPRWGPAVGGEALHTLVGMGVRTKTIFGVKVYAAGLYVDAAAAREALARWKGVGAQALAEDRAFRQALAHGSFGRSLRLVFCRDVDAEDVREAFEESLGPRVKAAAKRGLPGGEEALRRFRGFFDAGELEEGDEIVFSAWPDGRLVTRVKGREPRVVESQALCQALFDVYLDQDPIQERLRAELCSLFPEVLDGRVAPPAPRPAAGDEREGEGQK